MDFAAKTPAGLPGIVNSATTVPPTNTPFPYNVPFASFTDGTSPSTASRDMAWTYTRVENEIISVIRAAGLTPDKENWAQLQTAISVLAASSGGATDAVRTSVTADQFMAGKLVVPNLDLGANPLNRIKYSSMLDSNRPSFYTIGVSYGVGMDTGDGLVETFFAGINFYTKQTRYRISLESAGLTTKTEIRICGSNVDAWGPWVQQRDIGTQTVYQDTNTIIIQHTNGLREIWGYATSGLGGRVQVTWPAAFPLGSPLVATATILSVSTIGYTVVVDSTNLTIGSGVFFCGLNGSGLAGISFFYHVAGF